MAGFNTPNYTQSAVYTGFAKDSATSCGVLNLPDIINLHALNLLNRSLGDRFDGT